MQPLGLWSAAHAKHNPSFLGSTARCYQQESSTSGVQWYGVPALLVFLVLVAILTLLICSK